MGLIEDAFDEAAKKFREQQKAEDLTIIEPSQGMKFIKEVRDDGSIKEVRDVDSNYRLKKKEKEATFDEYAQYQKKQLKNIWKKATAPKKNKPILVGDMYLMNYVDNVKKYYQTQPFFYDRNKLFWFWQKDKCCYKIVDEVDLMNGIDDSLELDGATVNSKLKAHYIEAFRRVGRKCIPKEAPVKWVQFKDKAYSITSNCIYQVEPNFFFTNPIPWEIGDSSETLTLDKLFEEWVGKEYVKTLYEIIAYCCYRDYPIHTIFCLVGTGRNGKSKYQGIIRKFLDGKRFENDASNVCDIELDDLMNSRFEQFSLYKKLMCSIGETNFGTMTRTSRLKKLCGQDLVKFEKKGIQGFNDINYAKLIISSNSLPSSKDTSDGFYRRWNIIKFPNEFPEGKNVLDQIPDYEYNNLAKKVTEILPELIKNGIFDNHQDIEHRKQDYIMNSNPLPIFLQLGCVFDENEYVLYGELYSYYVQMLKKMKMRKVTMKEFRSALEDEGFWIEKTSKEKNGVWKSAYWVTGLAIKDKFWDNYDNFNYNSIRKLYIRGRKESAGINALLSQPRKTKFQNNLKCFVEGCNARKTEFDDSGVPYCEDHWDEMALKPAKEERI